MGSSQKRVCSFILSCCCMSCTSAEAGFILAEEWLQLADEQQLNDKPVSRGRARSNSVCITSTSDESSSFNLLSPEETLYFHTKEVLSQFSPCIKCVFDSKSMLTCDIACRSDESQFLKSEEYLHFCNHRKPVLQVTFVNFSEISITNLLSYFNAHLISNSCSGVSFIDYYLMMVNEYSLSFTILLCVIHNNCSHHIKASILKSSHLNVLFVDMIENEKIQEINTFLSQNLSTPASIIGVGQNSKNSLSESSLRKLLTSNSQYSFFEAFFKSKKKMKWIVDSIVHCVIHSQYNPQELNSASCVII